MAGRFWKAATLATNMACPAQIAMRPIQREFHTFSWFFLGAEVALPGEVFLSQVRLHTVYAIKKQGSSFIPKHPQSVPGQRSAFIQFPLQSVLLVSVCLKCLLLFCIRFYWCKKRSQAGLREVLSRLEYINHHAV